MADLLDVTTQENVVPDSNTPAPTPSTPPSDASLSSILDSALEKTQTPPAEPSSLTHRQPGPEDSADTGRPRDEHGRFLPKEAQQQLPLAPPQATPPAPVVPTYAEAPASWKAELKPHWEKVPGEVRGYLHQREQELQNGFQSVAHRAGVAEAVLNEFVPYAEQLQREGATPVAAIRTLLQTAHQLRTAGPEFRKAILLNLAEQYQIDLTSPVNEQLARAEGQAANLMTERMYGSIQQDQQIRQRTEQEFTAFANDPQNEFFPQVRGIMAELVDKGIARDMPTAYDMAVGMHADVRRILIERASSDRLTAERAKQAASVSVQGAPNGAAMRQAPPQGESLRATIERALGT